jgi:hypothetical protein
MNKRDDVSAAESISSPFENQMCVHKQVTQYTFGVKQGDSKNKQVPKYFADSHSDFKMAEVPVQEESQISDTTPISKSIVHGEDVAV